ncbi:MAG: GLPGLI family protein [Bacteroidia bacterium]
MHTDLLIKLTGLKNNHRVLYILAFALAFTLQAKAQTITALYTTRHLATQVNIYTNDSLTKSYTEKLSIPNSEHNYIYSNKRSLYTLTASPGYVRSTIAGETAPHILDYPTAEVFFKDLELGSMLLISTTGKGNANFSGDLPVFKWKITTEKKTIAQHLCRKATCTFNGKIIIAWYATDIKIKDGPARFNGLPGLILKVRVGDYLETTANRITIQPGDTEIIPPGTNEKTKQ